MAELILGLALIAVVYVVYIRVYPWRKCRACNGTGKHRMGSRWRDCGRCSGSGKRGSQLFP